MDDITAPLKGKQRQSGNGKEGDEEAESKVEKKGFKMSGKMVRKERAR